MIGVEREMRSLGELDLIALRVQKLVVVKSLILLKIEFVVLRLWIGQRIDHSLLELLGAALGVLFEHLLLAVDLLRIISLDEPGIVSMLSIELVLLLLGVEVLVVIVALSEFEGLESPTILVVHKVPVAHLRSLERRKSDLGLTSSTVLFARPVSVSGLMIFPFSTPWAFGLLLLLIVKTVGSGTSFLDPFFVVFVRAEGKVVCVGFLIDDLIRLDVVYLLRVVIRGQGLLRLHI